MKTYEFLLILSPQFSDEELPGVLDGIFDVVKKDGGEIKQHKIVGRQPLAYPIKHMKHGCYTLVEIEAETSALSKINRDLRLAPEILRFDISKNVTGKEISFDKKDFNKKEESETTPVAELEKIKEIKKEEDNIVVDEPELSILTPEEELEEPELTPSKQSENKISLEDLDKKLDEILNEEIL